MAAPPPQLVDDLIEEILVRFPPGDPALLIRAALVCKQWCRLVSGHSFRRRFRAFHRAAPMLGFFRNFLVQVRGHQESYTSRFVRTSTSCPPIPNHLNFALDARHGRVLLYSMRSPPGNPVVTPHGVEECYQCVVLDPATGVRRPLPELRWVRERLGTWSAAVLCLHATAQGGNACDHLDCHGGAFLVVVAFVGHQGYQIAYDKACVHVYSSEVGLWDKSAAIHDLCSMSTCRVKIGRSLLAGDALHFAIEDDRRILTYDLGGCGLSVLAMPVNDRGIIDGLVRTENGGLGVATFERRNIHLWSWRIDPDNDIGRWNKDRVIKLDLMPVRLRVPSVELHMHRFADTILRDPSTKFCMVGADTILVYGYDGLFAVALKSGKAKKVGSQGHFYSIVPYVSFYTRDQARGLSQH